MKKIPLLYSKGPHQEPTRLQHYSSFALSQGLTEVYEAYAEDLT